MFGKSFSPEFLAMQVKNKKGHPNPMFGKVKSMETLIKIRKWI